MTDDARAQLFRQILAWNDDRMLLERMKLHGFWPQGQGLPPDPQDEAAERKQIDTEMSQLRKQQLAVADPEQALEAERKRRWEESKQRRAENKKLREEQRQQRREQDRQRREENLVHAGRGVSGGLEHQQSDVALLDSRGLPVLLRSQDLAQQLGISLSALRWLTYHRRCAAVVHYHRYTIPKKSGGRRAISAPKSALKRAQQWVLDRILRRLQPSEQAHGFIAQRSIVSNAAPHAGQDVVINMDLRDFFPSITFRRVKGLFRKLGYSEHISVVLALLCTEPPRVEAELNGKAYFVALSDRVLPQGASTSPAITNAICLRLDRRLAGLAAKQGFRYTRYADDLTFSGGERPRVGRLIRSVRSILKDEGLEEHEGKTRVMGSGARQEVTGVVVNQRPTIARGEIRRLRAILHNAKRHGLDSQNRQGRPNFAEYLRGKVAYICMVDPKKGAPLRDALREIFND